MRALVLMLVATCAVTCLAAVVPPNAVNTPGALCSPRDADFKGVDYPEKVARCNRNIQAPEKLQVAANYGNLPQAAWPNFEFDHLIPLCAGGSNDAKNLWPQPLNEAQNKDVLENQICLAMRAGTLTQAEAVQKIHSWFAGNFVASAEQMGPSEEAAPGHAVCVTRDGIKVRFAISKTDRDVVSGVSINVITYSGDREAVRSDDALVGQSATDSSSPLEEGLVHYAIVEAVENNRFELILPSGLEFLPTSFSGYLKVGFAENTFPTLSQLTCNHN